MASVVSIQVGRVAGLGPERVPSGFVKTAVLGRVKVGVLGVDGDEQADHSVHGGPEKAVYFYPSEHYSRWMVDAARHEGMLVPGAFGENVTCVGLDEKSVAIGDVLGIGTTEMQVSQPRQPCFKLALRFRDNGLGRIMMQRGRTGWYVRVLNVGEMGAGDEIRVIRRGNVKWTIDRFNQFLLKGADSIDEMRELAELDGLASEWREGIAVALKDREEGSTG